MRPGKMAPAGGCGAVRGLWVPLAVLALARAALALTEQYPALSLLKQELHRQRQGPGPAGGCASAGEWAEQYSAESGESGVGAAMVTAAGAEEGDTDTRYAGGTAEPRGRGSAPFPLSSPPRRAGAGEESAAGPRLPLRRRGWRRGRRPGPVQPGPGRCCAGSRRLG